MAILNVTPDSFSDGGRFAHQDAAVAQGLLLATAGADLLDIGGESTRPGSDPVPPAEQLRRILPVIRALSSAVAVPISVDTTSAEVAEAALQAGAQLVNDIGAFRFDPAMLPLLAATGVPAIAMHTLGPPKTMQAGPAYDDVVTEVRDHLADRLEAASQAGVDPTQLILDPGIGFGKTLAHNLALLRGLPALAALGRPILVGTSRKSFLATLTAAPATGPDDRDRDRLMATAASVAVAIAFGAHLVRVHDVAQLRDVIRVADAIVRG